LSRRDEVALRIPAAPAFLSLAHVAASGAARQAGLSGAESDRLKTAVARECDVLVAGVGSHDRIALELQYVIGDGTIEVAGEVGPPTRSFRIVYRRGAR
jgi:hypothetical protein